jgi:hypothetical protein
MRYNIFAPQGGNAYGAVSLFRVQQELTFEWEPQADLLVYGEGRTSAAYTGVFKAPNVERKKPDGDAALNDNAL